MTPKQFYEKLLDEIAVDKDTMQDARDKRDELGTLIVNAVRSKLEGARYFGSGAVAQGTQTDPLNDVDIVVQADHALPVWKSNPEAALQDIADLVETDIGGNYEITTHAVKLQLDDMPFTADIVVGCTRPEGGIWIPHCPDHEPHRWIGTDPEQHRELVLERNRPYGRAVFSRQVRILKQFNAWCRYCDEENRKPLASFHITALALHILADWEGHDIWTPQFFKSAAELVDTPLDPPTGIGEPLTARDPAYARAELERAARETTRALSAPEDEVEQILRGVFGDPELLTAVVTQQPTAVTSRGRIVPGASTAGQLAASRQIKRVRSYGDDEPA